MGCDIHAFLERKDGDKWKFFQEVDIDQSYTLFALMAGTLRRPDIEPVIEAKGIPNDMSIEVADWWYNDPDRHTPSWLTLDEVSVAALRLLVLEGCRILDKVLSTMEAIAAEYPVRLVYWFDN